METIRGDKKHIEKNTSDHYQYCSYCGAVIDIGDNCVFINDAFGILCENCYPKPLKIMDYYD